MSVAYSGVLWNPFKKKYDRAIIAGALLYLILFSVVTVATNPNFTPETLILRAFGSLALIMLHIILVIGPLCRLNSKFLPLLYNRRHLGVSMFLAAFIHGGFATFQFHALSNTNPIRSIFTSNMDYTSLENFPFQILGFLALLILFAMAATSHDFFLKNLGAKVWKSLHMLVYLAYALIVMHVFLGAFQQEVFTSSTGFVVFGFVAVCGLHLASSLKERRFDRQRTKLAEDGWQAVCKPEEIEEDRAKIFIVDKRRVAVFKYEGKLSAIDNVCKHQGGPLGEGKVVDGCVTCPWHGYQYLPGNGQSPPPFTEKIATYNLKLVDGTVYIDPNPNEEGTAVTPVYCEKH